MHQEVGFPTSLQTYLLHNACMDLMVTALKGGVGKTTTAVHLAAAMNEEEPTMLIDMDEGNPGALSWAQQGSLPITVADLREGSKKRGSFSGHAVWDAPASPEQSRLLAALRSADLVVVPSSCEPLALSSLRTFLSLIDGQEINYRVLLTMVPPNPSPRGEQARAVLQNAGVPLFDAWIRRATCFQDAALNGRLVYEERSGTPRWMEYQSVAQEVLNG